MKQVKCLLVGYGVMGSALKKNWEHSNASFEIKVIDPTKSADFSNTDSVPSDYHPDVILFAVKPQTLPEILPHYQRFAKKGCLFLSIAAGVSLDTYHKHLGETECIVRAMPNLPLTVGQGMCVLVSKSSLDEQQKSLAESIFENTGQVIWVDKEALMDVVTAISGSGPAYFFKLVECLAAAGVANGLSSEVAMILARQTAIGAGSLLQHSSEMPIELRTRVTSPGGTTAAALDAFDEEHGLARLTQKAVKAAIQRAQELSK